MQTIKGRSTNSLPLRMLLACAALLVLRIAATVQGAMADPPHLTWGARPAEGKIADKPRLYLFVDSTNLATSFPTQILEQTAFTNREIISFVEQHFTPVRIDLKKAAGDKDKSYKADTLVSDFNVSSAPTLVVALANGTMVDITVGFKTDRSTLAFLKDAERNVGYQRALDSIKAEQWSEAAAYFDEALKNEQSDDDKLYRLLYRYVAERQGNITEKEAQEQLTRDLSGIKSQEWPRPCLDFLTGKLSADQVIAKAQTRKGELTEAHYLVGFTAALKGNAAEAREHFTWIRESGSRGYIEYDLALRSLSKTEPKTSADKQQEAGSQD